MSDTVGSLIDKLFTVDSKMWVNQEHLYEIRKMTFEEFKEKYWKDEQGAEKLWGYLQKACDLNLQRNATIQEIDEKLVEVIRSALEGEELDNGRFIQRQHKTY